MTKLAVSILVISMSCYAAAAWYNNDDNTAESMADSMAGFGNNWPDMQMPNMQMPSMHMPGMFKMPDMPAPLTPEDIRNLKIDNPGAIVSGSSSSSSRSLKVVNGQVVENTNSGDAIVNDDGDVQEISY